MAALLALAGCTERNVPAIVVQVPSGKVVRWPRREVVFTLAPDASGTRPPAALRTALDSAAERWNRALSGCDAPRLLTNREVLPTPLVGDDAVNVVLLHQQRWCPPGLVEPEDCYPRDSTGRTHLYPRIAPGSPTDGELNGADIELNGTPGAPPVRSLEASLMHELGHVLGLDHPCGPNSDFHRSRGERLRSCDDEDSKRQLMHPSWAARGDVEGMTPTVAEVRAVCATYAQGP